MDSMRRSLLVSGKKKKKTARWRIISKFRTPLYAQTECLIGCRWEFLRVCVLVPRREITAKSVSVIRSAVPYDSAIFLVGQLQVTYMLQREPLSSTYVRIARTFLARLRTPPPCLRRDTYTPYTWGYISATRPRFFEKRHSVLSDKFQRDSRWY